MYGNNLQSIGFERVNLLLQDTNLPTTNVEPGKRYFFPENPFLESKFITGIEVHGKPYIADAFFLGDFSDESNLQGAKNVLISELKCFYMTIYDKKGFLKFDNVPLASLFKYNPTQAITTPLFKKVNPYNGYIDFSKSFINIPANLLVTIPISYIPLTFYYK